MTYCKLSTATAAYADAHGITADPVTMCRPTADDLHETLSFGLFDRTERLERARKLAKIKAALLQKGV